MVESKDEIERMVDRETEAWDSRDVELLLSLFHPDMVWFWPPDNRSHDPVDWESPLGRFDRERWRKSYSQMFSACDLVRNDRRIVSIKVTDEGDGVLAVVDIDTLWEDGATGEWKMIAQTGVLLY